MASLEEFKQLGEKYEDLINQKKRNALQEKEFKERTSAIEQELLDAMTEAGQRNFKTTSGMTFYMRIDTFWSLAEGHTKEELIQALSDCDKTKDLVEVKCDMNSLRSRIKEIKANNESLPPEIMTLIKPFEKYKVGYSS